MAYWTVEELNTMVNSKRENPRISWDTIACMLNYRHTSSACQQRYNRDYAVIKIEKA